MNEPRFDWYQIIDESWLESLVDKAVNQVNIDRSSRGVSKAAKQERDCQERLITRHILSALYYAYTSRFPSDNSAISFPRDKSCFRASGNDLDRIHYSATYTDRVYKALTSLGWIESRKGLERVGYTRIWAEGDLAVAFKLQGFTWQKQLPMDRDKLVSLRDIDKTKKPNKKGKYPKIDLPVPHTEQVNIDRDFLYSYNQFLTNHCIAFSLDDMQLAEVAHSLTQKNDDEPWSEADQISCIDFSRLQLRRIFSRGSMDFGGRFYGGWWQGIPERYRAFITIDDNKTVEVDYSGMSIRVLYALKGLEFPLETDPYDIGLPDWQGTDDPRRKPIKTFINAYINDERGRYRLKRSNQELTGITHTELTNAVHKAHKPIQDSFGTLDGLKSMLIDSNIAQAIMMFFKDQGIVVLPIHDSFVIRAGFGASLELTMKSVFEQVLSARTTTTTSLIRSNKHFSYSVDKNTFKDSEQELNRFAKDPEQGLVNPEQLLEEIDKPISTMQVYVGSYVHKRWNSE